MNQTNLKGLGSLKTPLDLLQKIRLDFERLRKNPSNSYVAFDFFVSSYHMLDWLHPNDRKGRDSEEEDCRLLQLCSHIANGAKHFEATAKKHKSVRDVQNKSGVLNQGVLNTAVLNPNKLNFAGLFVYLNGEAAKEFRSMIGVIDLAKKILEHWESDPRLYPTNS